MIKKGDKNIFGNFSSAIRHVPKQMFFISFIHQLFTGPLILTLPFVEEFQI